MSDEDGDDSSAMRAMMGFSSFATSQRPKKEPQERTTTGGAFSASGANSAPLAKRAKTNNTSSKIKPLSSSPPTFWPASLPPQPTSAASYGTMSSTQSYNTAKEHQPLPGGPHDTWNDPPSARSQLSYSIQDTHYAPAPGTLPSPSNENNPGRMTPGIGFGLRTTPKYSSARPPGPPEYTNPDTGISFTRQELFELRNGKQNERGDLVFFQPSFVDPDPWAAVRKMSGRAGYGEKGG